MDLGKRGSVTGAEWIGQPQHEELHGGCPTQLPPQTTRSTTHLRVSSIHTPERCFAAATLRLAFLGLIPQRITATHLLTHERTCTGIRRRPPPRSSFPPNADRGRHSRGVLPVRYRRRDVALFPSYRASQARSGARRPSPSSSSC